MEITQNDRGWLVKSDTSGNTYQVRLRTRLDEMGSMYFEWTCDCPAGQHGRTCKHIHAAQQFRDEQFAAADQELDPEILEREVN